MTRSLEDKEAELLAAAARRRDAVKAAADAEYERDCMLIRRFSKDDESSTTTPSVPFTSMRTTPALNGCATIPEGVAVSSTPYMDVPDVLIDDGLRHVKKPKYVEVKSRIVRLMQALASPQYCSVIATRACVSSADASYVLANDDDFVSVGERRSKKWSLRNT